MKVVEFVCQYKEQMLAFVTRRLRRMARRNKYRMFVEGKIARSHGIFSNIFNSIKDKFNKVKSWVGQKWEVAKEFASGVFGNIKPMYDQLKSKVTAFFSEDFSGKIAKIQECVQTNKGIPSAIRDAVKGIKTRITNVYNIIKGKQWKELARLFISTVCSPSFKEAFTYLADGLSQSDLPKKYGLFGRFLGKILVGAPARRYRH